MAATDGSTDLKARLAKEDARADCQPHEKGLNKALVEYRGVYMMWENCQPELFPTFAGRDSDVWVASFPRSGTTLMQELTYLIRTRDFKGTQTVPLDARFTFADVYNQDLPFYPGIKGLAAAASPRLMKTHFHHCLLPDDLLHRHKGKLIYVARNPKAVVVSLYKLMTFLRVKLAATFDEFVEMFLHDKVYGSPWYLHVQQFLEHRHEPDILFLRYEDITKDKRSVIKQIASFLGCQVTEADMELIIDHTDIESMKANEMVNFGVQEKVWSTDKTSSAFINQGGTTWKDILTKEQQAKIDQMVIQRLGNELGNRFI